MSQSVYVLFLLFELFPQFFLTNIATNPPFMSGLRVKGDIRARLTSFPRQKGGEKLETIFFSNNDRKSVRLYLQEGYRKREKRLLQASF